MALTKRHSLINALQRSLPRGRPFDSRALAKLGISSALAHHYLEAKWLVRLGRGVFMFSGDSFQRDASLSFLAMRIPNLHVGGKTALAWRGVRHNLSDREPLCLWGTKKMTLPSWFTTRFPSHYTTRSPFSSSLAQGYGLNPLPETPDGPLVSEPERALLEMLSEVGIHQVVEEARNIMEGVRSVRAEVLEKLLKNCERVKVLRLCVLWAEELNLPWAAAARKSVGGRFGTSRWMARLKDGTILTLKA